MANIISLCIAICLLILICYFLFIGKLSGWIFFLCVVAVLFFLIVFFVRDRIQEVVAYNFGFKLNEIQKIQKDIYAKTEEVKKMGESIAQMIAENIAMENRFVSEKHVFQRIERREKIEKLLKDMEVDELKIKEIVKSIDIMVTFDLYHDLLDKAKYNRMGVEKIPWVEEFRTNIRKGIEIDITELRKNLEQTDFFNLSEIQKEFNNLEYFLANRSLPSN